MTKKPAARSLRPAAGDSVTCAAKLVSLDNNEIADLAFSFWRERGFMEGSPEEDWLRAVETLLRRKGGGAEAAG